MNLLDIKVNPNYLLFSERETERERERESPKPVVRGWSGGPVALDKLSVPRRPTNLDNSRARVYCACSSWDIFKFVYLFSFLFPSFGDGPI